MSVRYTWGMRKTPREPRKLGDSVETTRAAPVDWSNLAEEYSQAHSMRPLARKYHTSDAKIRAQLVAQGVEINPVGGIQGSHTSKGKPKSQAWRDASRKHWDDPVWREQQRARWLERLPTMNGTAVNGPLERLLHRALLKAGISFTTQVLHLRKYCVDIQINQAPVVIEADGNTHLRKQAEDAQRDADLLAEGFRVFRFGGRAISTDPDGCVRQVVEECDLTPDANPTAEIRNGMVGKDNPRWIGGPPTWTCSECGQEFTAHIGHRRGKPPAIPTTCSRKCQGIRQSRLALERAQNRTCEWCGKKFSTSLAGKKNRFCSMSCAAHWRQQERHPSAIKVRTAPLDVAPRMVGSRTCEWCGIMFNVTATQKTKRFCGQSCASHWRWQQRSKTGDDMVRATRRRVETSGND